MCCLLLILFYSMTYLYVSNLSSCMYNREPKVVTRMINHNHYYHVYVYDIASCCIFSYPSLMLHNIYIYHYIYMLNLSIPAKYQYPQTALALAFHRGPNHALRGETHSYFAQSREEEKPAWCCYVKRGIHKKGIECEPMRI